ncbi:cupin domain-containing protein [Pseudomonas aeruginosa]|nr:cupin domain-containing protein [Pseudomonas aeruginosa]
MSDFITVLRDTCPVPVLDATKWKRIDGDPHTVNLNAYASADGSKLMGTWICTPGKWEVNYERWEFCLLPRRLLHHHPGEGEQPVHLRAGDVFVIEPGLRGTWEVVETVRKVFRLRLTVLPHVRDACRTSRLSPGGRCGGWCRRTGLQPLNCRYCSI